MQQYYICDLRKKWARRPYISFWRPNNAGYAYPLPWAGRYTAADISESPSYYTRPRGAEDERFPVPCDEVDKLATAPRPGDVDGDIGPVVLNRKRLREALRALRVNELEPA